AFNMRLLIGCTRAPLLTRRMFQKGFERSCPRLPDFMSACRLTSGVSSDHGPDTDGLWTQGWNDGDRTGKTCSSDPSWPKTLRSALRFPSLGKPLVGPPRSLGHDRLRRQALRSPVRVPCRQ